MNLLTAVPLHSWSSVSFTVPFVSDIDMALVRVSCFKQHIKVSAYVTDKSAHALTDLKLQFEIA